MFCVGRPSPSPSPPPERPGGTYEGLAALARSSVLRGPARGLRSGGNRGSSSRCTDRAHGNCVRDRAAPPSRAPDRRGADLRPVGRPGPMTASLPPVSQVAGDWAADSQSRSDRCDATNTPTEQTQTQISRAAPSNILQILTHYHLVNTWTSIPSNRHRSPTLVSFPSRYIKMKTLPVSARWCSFCAKQVAFVAWGLHSSHQHSCVPE